MTVKVSGHIKGIKIKKEQDGEHESQNKYILCTSKRPQAGSPPKKRGRGGRPPMPTDPQGGPRHPRIHQELMGGGEAYRTTA